MGLSHSQSFVEKYTSRSRFFQCLGEAGRLLAMAYAQADTDNQAAIRDLAFQAMLDGLVEFEGYRPQDVAEIATLNSEATTAQAEALELAQRELEMLRVALVDSVHRMHSTPLHMLPRGVGMSMGPGVGDESTDVFGVNFRAGDGSKHEVRVTRGLLDAVTVALDAEDARLAALLSPVQTKEGEGA